VIKFEVDEPKRLLVIRYCGVVEAEETEKGLEQIRNGLAKLQSGFRLLADLTELESMDMACAPFIEKAMDMCNEKGASMVVRVIPDPHRDIGMQIMSIFHYRGDVQIFTCETLAQAKDLLEN
jgi:anti-anti-sigma regulatory factor